jgi:hypothetical protein
MFFLLCSKFCYVPSTKLSSSVQNFEMKKMCCILGGAKKMKIILGSNIFHLSKRLDCVESEEKAR